MSPNNHTMSSGTTAPRAPSALTGRTIMFEELADLLEARHPSTSLDAYREAVVEENALAKATSDGRRRSFQFLRRLYALDPDDVRFRALRRLWDVDPSSRRLGAALVAASRDRVFSTSVGVMASTPVGVIVTPQVFSDAIEEALPRRFSARTRLEIGRRIASSWEQAGLLAGVSLKQRRAATVTASTVALALYLSHLDGVGGTALFTAPLVSVISDDSADVRALAQDAAARGLIGYRADAGVVEVSFAFLERPLDEP